MHKMKQKQLNKLVCYYLWKSSTKRPKVPEENPFYPHKRSSKHSKHLFFLVKMHSKYLKTKHRHHSAKHSTYHKSTFHIEQEDLPVPLFVHVHHIAIHPTITIKSKNKKLTKKKSDKPTNCFSPSVLVYQNSSLSLLNTELQYTF